jgi:hypothetical protein
MIGGLIEDTVLVAVPSESVEDLDIPLESTLVRVPDAGADGSMAETIPSSSTVPARGSPSRRSRNTRARSTGFGPELMRSSSAV